MTDLVEYDFWADVAERAVRQLYQVLSPVLGVMAATGAGFDLKNVGLAVLLALLVTALKAVAEDAIAPAGAPVWRVLLDRGGAAGAGAVLALLPTDALDLGHVDVVPVASAFAAAVLLSVLGYFAAPPMKGKHTL